MTCWTVRNVDGEACSPRCCVVVAVYVYGMGWHIRITVSVFAESLHVIEPFKGQKEGLCTTDAHNRKKLQVNLELRVCCVLCCVLQKIVSSLLAPRSSGVSITV